MDDQQVKGTGIVPVVNYIKVHHGDDGLAMVLDRLPEPVRQVFGRRIMPITWYPHEAISLLYAAISDQYAGGDPAYCWRVGKDAADYGLSLIYKLFLSFNSPQLFGSKGPEMWRTYYRPSTLEVLRNDRGALSVLVHGMSTTPAHVYSIAGWIERAGELTGGRDIKVAVDVSAMRYDVAYR